MNNERQFDDVNIPAGRQVAMPLDTLLPLTNGVAQAIPDGSDLTAILHVNHLLDDVLELNRIFVSRNYRVLFVPVSYHRESDQLLKEAEYEVFFPSRHGAVGSTRVEAAVHGAIAKALQSIDQSGSRILVLEDGGYHYHCVSNFKRIEIVGAIEQTANGVRNLLCLLEAGHTLEYPVLSVARSKIKTRIENKFIAKRAIEELSLLLYSRGDFLKYRNVLVIGYGMIGREVALVLRSCDCHVTVIERNDVIKAAAVAEGFAASNAIQVEHFTEKLLVVGATGERSFGVAELELFFGSRLHELSLVSVSSKQIEFEDLLDVFETGDVLALGTGSVHCQETRHLFGTEYRLSAIDRECVIAMFADGKPVNFFRPGCESLSTSVIDLVNAELVGLVGRLMEEHHGLPNKLRLLGRDPIGIHIDECDLVDAWAESNCLRKDVGQTRLFEPHPCEAELINAYSWEN